MNNNNLVDISTRPDHVELSRKGGSVKSERKSVANRVTALRRSDKYSPEQQEVLSLLANRDFLSCVQNLLSVQLDTAATWQQKDTVIKRLISLLPNTLLTASVKINGNVGDLWAHDIVHAALASDGAKCKQV